MLTDEARTAHVYFVNPLRHVDGMLMVFLPKEKLLIEADLVDTNVPLPATLSRDQQGFFRAVQKLKLDVGQTRADPRQAGAVVRLRAAGEPDKLSECKRRNHESTKTRVDLLFSGILIRDHVRWRAVSKPLRLFVLSCFRGCI